MREACAYSLLVDLAPSFSTHVPSIEQGSYARIVNLGTTHHVKVENLKRHGLYIKEPAEPSIPNTRQSILSFSREADLSPED